MRRLLIMFSMLLCTVSMYAQSKVVTGKVTDDKDGTPLSGVSVTVKGTTIGTATDADGLFRLTVPATAKTLIISLVNYESTEVPVDSRASYNVKLVSKDKSLQEVVVVGYGVQKKKELTGNLATVKVL